MPNLWPGNCFACSPRNRYGLKLIFFRTEQGIAHGGIVATLLDEVAAWALIAHAGNPGLPRT